MQRLGEEVLQVIGEPVEPCPCQDGRHAVHVGAHRVEDQVAQPSQHGQCAYHRGTGHGAGDERHGDHGRGAAAPAFDDAGQAADIGTVDDSHQTAETRDQKGDHPGGDHRGDQHAEPVAIGQQPHRDGAQQRQSAGKRDDDSDDRGRRAKCRHDRRLREFAWSAAIQPLGAWSGGVSRSFHRFCQLSG